MKKRILICVGALAFFVAASSFNYGGFYEIAKQIEIFTTLFKELNMNYVDEVNPAELMDTAIKEMLDDLDPYTRYMNEQDVEDFKMRNAGEYSGIGASVRSYKNKLLIIEPYKGYPADRAGLKAGDEVIKIDDILISDFKDDAGELLKGTATTSINITYLRNGKEKQTEITREEIEIDAVPFYDMADDKTGYIVLSKFNRKASSQTKDALVDLQEQGAERIILDLRNNPGGLLSEAINVVNLFVTQDKLIVTTRSKVKKFNREYRTREKEVDSEIPIVVLVNNRSASASEIVAGALQDLDRAVVVGARTFGKGLVQRPMKLTYGTQLKVTISRYYTPSGRCIQSLDYWNRDEDGKAVENLDNEKFKTANGRDVFGGGGVLPDREVASLKTSDLSTALQDSNVIFDYATNFYYQNSKPELDGFEFSKEDFNGFKSFVKNSGFEYQTDTETALKAAVSDEELALFGENVVQDFKKLLGDIDHSKMQMLDKQESELVKKLEDEIIKRYFYREGLFNYYLKNDEAILEAREILDKNSVYKRILGL